MTDFDVLGYVVARGVLGTPDASVLIAAGVTDDGDVESTWSHDDEHALLLPSRTAAVMLACAIGAGDAQILTTVTERRAMTKTQLKQEVESALRGLLAKGATEAQLRSVVAGMDANDAAWDRVCGRAKATVRKGAKRGGARAR